MIYIAIGTAILCLIQIVAILKAASRKMPTPTPWTTEDHRKRREILYGDPS